MTTSLVNRAGFGLVVNGQAVIDGSAVLGVTPVKVTLPSVTDNGGLLGYVRIRVVNPNGAGVILATEAIGRGAAAPTFDATFSTAGGRHVLPGHVDEFIIPTVCDLYIVASAAASSWAVHSMHVH
jgi:hypothetical protein